jgi:hypothetical protein
LDYLEAIKSTHRIFALKLEIDTAFETFSLTDKDVDMGSLKLEEGCATGSTLTLGEAKAASFSISIGNRDGRYDDTQFNGGIMRPVLGLELPGGSLEWVPLGIFNIDDVSRPTTSVSLEGADDLILFDVAFSGVPVSFPTTNKQLLAAICNHVGVSLATASFLNDGRVVQKAPSGTQSCRDIVKCIAELAAGYAQCDRTTGALKIVQFQNPGCVQEANLDSGDFLGTDHTAKGNSVTFGAPFGTIVKSLAGTGNTTQTVTHQGKNLINLEDGTYSANGITATVNNGEITINGSPTVNFQLKIPFVSNLQLPINTDYTHTVYYNISNNLSCAPTIARSNGVRQFPFVIDWLDSSVTQKSATGQFSEDMIINHYDIYFATAGETYDNVHIKVQFEQGSISTAYEPFVPESPSPDYPAPIHGVEYIEKWEGMSAENRNLLNPISGNATSNGVTCTVDADGTITLDGTVPEGKTPVFNLLNASLSAGYEHNATAKFRLESGKPYTFSATEISGSFSGNGGGYEMWDTSQNTSYPAYIIAGLLLKGNKTFIGGTPAYAHGSSSLEVGGLFLQGYSPCTFSQYRFRIQLEQGNTATSWKPALESLPSYQKIMLPQPLYNLPNGAADSYDAIGASGIKRVGKKVFNGTEGWGIAGEGDTTTGISFYCQLSDMKHASITAIQNVCDKLPVIPYTETLATPRPLVFFSVQTNIPIINVKRSMLSTQDVAGFKAFLAANPVTILYELATPVAITGTPQSVTASADTTVTADNGGQAEVTYNTPDGDNADGGDFKWYNTKKLDGGAFIVPDPAVSLGPANRYDFKIDDNPVTVTGIVYEAQDKDYVIGDRSYALHITDNTLIQGDPTDVLERIADAMIGFTYLPFTSSWQGNPALQPGDIIQQTDRNGVSYRTIVTNSTYIYRGVCDLSAKGASEIAHGFQSQQTKRATQLLRLIHEKEVKISSLDQAILNATSLIAGALGSHWIDGDKLPDEKYHGNVFIADNADITKAKKVWRWNLGGFGHSNNGVDGPYTAAITADDSIVANLVTASMIKTGRLESLTNPNVYFDLDEGVLCASRLVSSEDGATDVAAKIGTLTYSDGYKGKGLLLSSQQMPGGFFLIMQNEKDSLGSYKTDAASTGDLALRSNTESGEASNALEMFNDANNHGTIRFNRATGNGEHETAFSAEDAFFMLGHGNNSLVITDNGQYFSNGSYGTVDLRKADGGVFTLCLDGGIATNG